MQALELLLTLVHSLDKSRSLLCRAGDAGFSKVARTNSPADVLACVIAAVLDLMEQTQAGGFLVVVFQMRKTLVVHFDRALLTVGREAFFVAHETHHHLPPFG
jgi:hypothetical protein